ncbi:hypothetical protein AAY473_032544 [Plecturocebus cupreus]
MPEGHQRSRGDVSVALAEPPARPSALWQALGSQCRVLDRDGAIGSLAGLRTKALGPSVYQGRGSD